MSTAPASGRGTQALARLFARGTDGVIALVLTVAVTILLTTLTGTADAMMRWSTESVVGGLVINFGLIVVGHMLYDFICTRAFGVTPGKALLGLRIVSEAGGKPTWRQSAIRTALVWTTGLALAIPFASIVTGVFGYMTLQRDGVTFWDSAARLYVEKKPVGVWRWGLAVLVWAAMIGVGMIGALAD